MQVTDYTEEQINHQAMVAYNDAKTSLKKLTWPTWEDLSEFHKDQWRRRMRREI